MNEQQLLRDYEREALHQYRQEHYGQDNANSPSNAWESMLAGLGHVDWNAVFVVVARGMISLALGYITYRYWLLFHLFGAAAISMIGQYLIALFFTKTVWGSDGGTNILSSSLGMYLLTGMF